MQQRGPDVAFPLLTPRPAVLLQLAGTEVKAPFQALAEGFHRAYADRMREVPSIV